MSVTAYVSADIYKDWVRARPLLSARVGWSSYRRFWWPVGSWRSENKRKTAVFPGFGPFSTASEASNPARELKTRRFGVLYIPTHQPDRLGAFQSFFLDSYTNLDT